MDRAAAFLRLSRPKFLIGGFAGFALGAAIAAYEGASITLAGYAAGQAMVTAFHLMTHYANDYFDRSGDRHGVSGPFSGGSGVLVRGELAPGTALAAALFCASLGSLGVAGFALTGQFIVAGIGAAIGILAWCYSAPPLRLSARGWGEVDTAAVVAVLVPLAGYAAFTGTVDGLALAATLAPACAMFAMMLAVEWPDREADAAGGKRNLLVRLGPAAAGRLAAAGALAIVPALLVPLGRGAPWTGIAFALLLVPLVAGFLGWFHEQQAPAELAARGVSLFLLTVVFEALGYVAVLPWAPAATVVVADVQPRCNNGATSLWAAAQHSTRGSTPRWIGSGRASPPTAATSG
ncbi:MAG: prenyltransferase [Candidatus Velthaea sp.]|jgi:1,4-dihydroxy-2-naphthoate octaprenyltransferase